MRFASVKDMSLVAVCIICLAGTWEIVFRMGFLNPIIFSSPSRVYLALLSDWDTFYIAMWNTSFEVLFTIFITWPIGIYVGTLVGRSPFLSSVASPIFSALIAIPLVVLYPLFVIAFGIGWGSKVMFALVLGVFPIASNTMVGIRSIEPGYAKAAWAMGASPRQIMFRVMIPMAAPHIFNGLRLGTSLIIAGVVLAEMLASTDGLGFWISYHRTIFKTGHVYAGVMLILAITVFANAILILFENWLGAVKSSTPRKIESGT